MGSLPVTNVENGFTYSNFYCSVCNNDVGEKQVRFRIDVTVLK
jgi:hypothetical protein